MPRKSAAALSVVAPPLEQKRPEPPDELTPEQAGEWRKVVNRLPPDWFPSETHGLLVQYCRHMVKARVVAAHIDKFDPAWLDDDGGLMRYDKLTQIAEREGRALSSLATRMRLTQQSRYHKATAGNTAASRKAPEEQWKCVA